MKRFIGILGAFILLLLLIGCGSDEAAVPQAKYDGLLDQYNGLQKEYQSLYEDYAVLEEEYRVLEEAYRHLEAATAALPEAGDTP